MGRWHIYTHVSIYALVDWYTSAFIFACRRWMDVCTHLSGAHMYAVCASVLVLCTCTLYIHVRRQIVYHTVHIHEDRYMHVHMPCICLFGVRTCTQRRMCAWFMNPSTCTCALQWICVRTLYHGHLLYMCTCATSCACVCMCVCVRVCVCVCMCMYAR